MDGKPGSLRDSPSSSLIFYPIKRGRANVSLANVKPPGLNSLSTASYKIKGIAPYFWGYWPVEARLPSYVEITPIET